MRLLTLLAALTLGGWLWWLACMHLGNRITGGHEALSPPGLLLFIITYVGGLLGYLRFAGRRG